MIHHGVAIEAVFIVIIKGSHIQLLYQQVRPFLKGLKNKKMFPRALSAFILALPVLAAARPLPQENEDANNCFNATLLCCGTYMPATKQACMSLIGMI